MTATPLPSTRWRPYGLALVRAAWLLTAVLAVSVLAASVPAYLAHLGMVTEVERLRRAVAGLPTGVSDPLEYWLDLASMIVQLASAGACLGLAAVIFWRRPDDRMAVVHAFFLPVYGMVMVGPLLTLVELRQDWLAVVGALESVVFAAWALLFCLFPDGQFVPRWTRWLCAAFVPWTIALLVFRDYLAPTHVIGVGHVAALIAWYMPWPIISLLAQVYRYRRVSNAVQRQQTKWVLFATALFVVVILLLAGPFLYSMANRPDNGLTGLHASGRFDGLLWSALISALPLTMGVAILRYRLFDIDLLINRTLVYGSLTVIVVAVYVLAVGSLSALFQAGGSFVLSLVATGLIAVFFQPLRERLQRGVNRLLYGERDDPYTVLSRLGQRLETALAPEAVLPAIVETAAQTLKLPYAAVSLQAAGAGEPEVAAAYGQPVPAPVHLPLTYQSERVGELLIAPRGPGESFTPAEQRLLQDIAHQAGVAAHAVRLAADLQRSRERLVTAREEERRRLRRDLHDGLGPALAVHSLKVGSARSLLTRDQAALAGSGAGGRDVASADALLAELEQDIAATLTDLRRLVYDLRPPTLDELGLAAAVRESAARYAPGTLRNPDGLHIAVEAPEPLPPLPAAVEVAAFRITQEALTNVVRYAQAHTCRISLKLDDGLWVEIVDDGVGMAAEQDKQRTGVGLASMRERAAELGGTCLIETPPAGGTRVLAHLPLG